jgi:hypothetical protein
MSLLVFWVVTLCGNVGVYCRIPRRALLSHWARVVRLDRYSRADSYDCYSSRDLLRLLTLHLEAGFVMKHNNVS